MEISDESLIENVQIHPLLYNLKLPQYRDHNMRQEAWEEIGNKLNMPAETVKKKWDKLRRCYINALSRRRSRREDSTKNVHPWKYELQMSFLLPFIESRKYPLNFPDNVEIFIDNSDIQNENKYDTAEDQDQEYDENLYDNHDSSNLSAKLSLPSVKKFKIMKSDNAYQEGVNVCNEDVNIRNQKLNERYSTSILDMDETDMFFISMSKMTKKLAPIDQAKIKLLLSNAVLSAQISMSENQSQQTFEQFEVASISKMSPD